MDWLLLLISSAAAETVVAFSDASVLAVLRFSEIWLSSDAEPDMMSEFSMTCFIVFLKSFVTRASCRNK